MVYTLRFYSLQNAVCFIILTYLVPVLFTFYIQDVLKFKKNNSGAKRLKRSWCKFNHMLPFSAKMKNGWSYTSVPPSISMRCEHLQIHNFFFSFTIHRFIFIYITFVGRDGSVVTATHYDLHGPWIESRWGRVQTGLGASLASYAIGTVYLTGVKPPGLCFDHLPPSSAEMKERVEL